MDAYYKVPPFKGGRRWVTEPHQRGRMLMWMHPDVKEIVRGKAAQRGDTEIALGAHMYLLEDPGETSVYFMPTDGMAKRLDRSVKHWQKTVAPVGDKLLADKNSFRDSRNTIQEKEYTTANQYFFGGSTAANTSQFTVTFGTIDEAERTPGSVDGQGSLWAGLDGRFAGSLTGGRKRIFSTLLTEDGIISVLMAECDHVFNCEMPCPLCGEYSVLRWGEKEDGWGIRFAEEGTSEERAATVEHVCRHCKKGWTQDQYADVIDDCRWVSESGYRYDHTGDGDFKRLIDGKWQVVKAPYKLGLIETDDGAGLYGTSDWADAVRRLIDYTAQYKKTGSAEDLKRFSNEFRAIPFDTTSAREIPTDELLNRREDYNHPIPDDVQYLVMGVDFGLDYSKYQIDGFGEHDRYGIKIVRTEGDSEDEDSRMFTDVDVALSREYKNRFGKTIPLVIAILDGRYAGRNVRKLAAKNPMQRIVVHGDGTNNPRKKMFDHQPKKDWSEEHKCFEVSINPHEASHQLYYKLRIPKGEQGYYHIPKTEDFNRFWADEVTSDKKKKRKINGRWVDGFYEKDHSRIKGESHDTGKYIGIGQEVVVEFNRFDVVENYDASIVKQMAVPEQSEPVPDNDFSLADAYD